MAAATEIGFCKILLLLKTEVFTVSCEGSRWKYLI